MENKPLLDWTYSSEEWDQYVEIERANKKEDNIYFGVAILIIGIPFLLFFRATSFLMALSFTLPFALLIPWLRMKISYPYLKKGSQQPSVQVFRDYMLINQKRIDLFGDKRRVKSLQIITNKNDKKLLEFDVQWLTRKGPTNDEFRILVPPKNQEEATQFIKEFGF